MDPESPYSLDGLRPDPNWEETAFRRFDQSCEKYGERVAISYLGTPLTYGWLADAVRRMATALHELGVRQGQRVMLYLPNTPQWIVANFAIQKLGAVVVPVAPIYTAHELRFMARDAGIETVFCLDTNFGYIDEIFDDTPLQRVIVTTLVELLPAWKRSLGRLLKKVPTGRVSRRPWVHSFGQLLRTPPRPPTVTIDPWRDLATIMYTGGTTAGPKAVPGNHMTEVAYLRDITRDVLSSHVRPGEDRLLIVLPLYHIMARGFFFAVGLFEGNTTVLMPVPNGDVLLKEIELHRVRWLLGVPTLYRRLLENDRADHYRLDSLRFCLSGGDVLPREVGERWRQRTGAAIHQVYGSTEVGHVAYSDLGREPVPGSVGRPLKSFGCRVVDLETLEERADGEVGELLVTSPFNIKSYWRRPQETERSYVRLDGEIYYRTGDLVSRDTDGEIRFVERTGDVIKYKALRISASEVEAALQDHPAVVGACVVGVPDEAVGERIKAIVVLKDDVRGVAGGDLKTWCRQHLATFKVPHYIEFRDMLPKSKVGKLLRREIREEESRKREAAATEMQKARFES